VRERAVHLQDSDIEEMTIRGWTFSASLLWPPG